MSFKILIIEHKKVGSIAAVNWMITLFWKLVSLYVKI